MATKKEKLNQEISRTLKVGKAAELETVNFDATNRPDTCLEVDLPILSVNELAAIEASSGATKKPIYQLSKWWARRQPSVFRSILIAAATKAPDDPSEVAKFVWNNYYANHQNNVAFQNLKIADIFMGGGTTLIEGARLGMRTLGNDLNPIAWFIVKQSLAQVDMEEVKSLLDAIYSEVRSQIIPFYACDGPGGEKGTWVHLATNSVMGSDFDPLHLSVQERREYRYDGPEIIYTFWSKHGPCQVTGCGHRTPIMNSPLMAVKSLSVKYWEHRCANCGVDFDVEECEVRMAPDAPLFIVPDEKPFSIINPSKGAVCPSCGHSEIIKLGKGKNKKVNLSLLVHPAWLAGSSAKDSMGSPYGGTAQDDLSATSLWNHERASKIRLLEVRGELPEQVTCPVTDITFSTGRSGGTVPGKSEFACAACGAGQDVLESIKSTKKTGPVAAYAVKAYSPIRESSGAAYGGRFFAAFDEQLAKRYDAAVAEWDRRKNADLANYWPKSELPYGFMTHHLQGGVPNHGYSHWWTMFNPRQLLVHALLLKSISTLGNYKRETRDYVFAAMQQYLRNQNMFCFWNIQTDKLEPLFSNNNYHPKATVVENSVYPKSVRGNWAACIEGLFETSEWRNDPWETVSNSYLERIDSAKFSGLSGKSSKVYPGDRVKSAVFTCGSSTSLDYLHSAEVDLIITDPPFGGLLHYSELSDFFYVWMRLVLKDEYPEYFCSEYTPKSLEAVANPAREPEDADAFYQKVLTQCWREAHRALKPGGILAFTFHHSEDEPWVAVLESLFDAGFYLVATYPIRSDETKGEGEFGSKTIEYDIVHVCRKRTEEPKPVSWGRMRREVMTEVRQLQALLENHAKEGLPAADLQVIRRGKALEYFSRHYGKVYVDEGRTISVKDALVGINQLIDEDADKGKEPPPVNAEPMTRQFLRTFGRATEIKRDQLQKFLKGSITTPDDFVQRGWCIEKNKVFTRINSLDFAREWVGKHRRRLTSDLDQALVMVGACFDNSGINASDTLRNGNFKPHVALRPLLEWLQNNGPDQTTRNAASRAVAIYTTWAGSLASKPAQGSLFEEYEL